jgi:ribosomal protein S18 acetylase RimI-like enzyme
MNKSEIKYRQQIQSSDIDAVARIVTSSGFFSRPEIDLAIELAKEKLAEGEVSSYQFLFAEDKTGIGGYTCFGVIPATDNSYDLYWIAVNQQLRGLGLGKILMARTEEIIHSLGGKRIYVETSSRNQYKSTHAFYESCGYFQEAVLKDFYAEGDSKVIYSKTFQD